MDNQESDVIRELEFYIKSNLPLDAIEAWYNQLSSENQEIIRNYLAEVFNKVVAKWEEIGKSVYAAYSEAIKTSGIGTENDESD